MKTYIFITMSICNIGGAEQYIYNKRRFLLEQGYNVMIVSAMFGDILISDFEEYERAVIPAVMYAPNCFSKRERRSVLATVDALLDRTSTADTSEWIVESNSIDAAKWGEMLAKRYQCKHVCFDLQEVHNYSPTETAFLKYKYDRKELAGITEKSIAQILKDETVARHPWTRYAAYCNNVVADCEDAFSHRLTDGATLRIGSIGRLEKPWLLQVLPQLKALFQANGDKQYDLVLIGGTNVKSVNESIMTMFSDVENVNVVVTGYLYPIPRALFKNIDVFVSTAGSATVSYLEQRPTIKVHPESGEPVGVYGYSYFPEKSTMYDVIPDTCVVDLIQELPNYIEDIQYGDLQWQEDFEATMQQEFSRQLGYATEEYVKEYYDTQELYQPSTKYYLYKIFGHLLGQKRMQQLAEKMRAVMK